MYPSLLKAQEEGYFNAYIICPVGVHGIGGGPVKRASMIFKVLPVDALQSKKFTYIGEGTNVFSWVCVYNPLRFARIDWDVGAH